MQTIPDEILAKMLTDRPDLAAMVANLRAGPILAAQIERHIAFTYLEGTIRSLAPTEAWHLAQVAYGGPWGGDWVTTERAAGLTGYDPAHLRRLAPTMGDKALKRGKTWYLRRDALPHKAELE